MLTPEQIEVRLDRILLKVQKPGRYVGGEFNTFTKDWDSVQTRVAFVFPEFARLHLLIGEVLLLFGLVAAHFLVEIDDSIDRIAASPPQLGGESLGIVADGLDVVHGAGAMAIGTRTRNLALHRHCEERSDEAIQSVVRALDCFASLAMTKGGGK